MQTTCELIDTLATGLFTGAAFYILSVEHPARLECGPALGVKEFVASYRRAKIMQPSLAFLGFVAGLLAWREGSPVWWLLGGIGMGSLFPFTIIWMLPINNELNRPGLGENPDRARQLLVRWGQLHAIRCLIGLMTFILFLLLLR